MISDKKFSFNIACFWLITDFINAYSKKNQSTENT